MTPRILFITTVAAICTANNTFAQAPTQAETQAMAQRMRTMTPEQIMQFRDSLTNAVMNHEAKTLPNGNQLLETHHYDTGYTTITFHYAKKEETTSKSGSSATLMECDGTSEKAPMIYEANGYAMVKCSMGQLTGFTLPEMDTMASALNKNTKYKTQKKANDEHNIASQTSFSSMTANDNSLHGAAIYTEESTRSTMKLTKKDVTGMSFSFMYDPSQNISAIGAGADVVVTLTEKTGRRESHDEKRGMGISAGTDPSKAHITGAGPVKKDPNATYAEVTRTADGYEVKYTKNNHHTEQGVTTNITETLTATIGKPHKR